MNAAIAINRCVRSLHRRAPELISEEVNHLLASHSQQLPQPLTLSKILSYGRPLTSKSVLDSASLALSEVPRRLSLRVRTLEKLPYIVGTNPFISHTLNAYRTSFQWLAGYPEVKTLEENEEFVAQLEYLVQSHANDIPTMAKGFQECARYMSPVEIASFLDGAIRNRIAVRLIAEQHIALSQALQSFQDKDHHGVVNVSCSPADMIRSCAAFVSDMCEATFGASPPIVIDGNVGATFAYVPVHLEYIITELLKNSFRATIEHHKNSPGSLPPVLVSISPPRNAGLQRPSFMSIRIRDQGGGIPPKSIQHVFSYAFTTARSVDRGPEDEFSGSSPVSTDFQGAFSGDNMNLFGEISQKGLQTGIGTIAGLGYGLPMSKIYARYFGGSLDLISLDGWGADVFLKLKCLSEAGNVEI